MALKKTFDDSTEYYYAVITYIGYCKDPSKIMLNTRHKVDLTLYIKDTEDDTKSIEEQRLSYIIPAVKVNKDDPDLDQNYVDPLDVNNMQPKDENVVKLCYQWLLENIKMFSEYNNC